MKLITFTLVILSCISCSKNNYVTTTPSNLLILGNSIVRHSPRQEVGWNGDWGMAASVADSDFVHRIMNSIKINSINYKTSFLNIANFETGYFNYDLNKLDSLKNSNVVIIKIWENVVEKTALDSNFIFW